MATREPSRGKAQRPTAKRDKAKPRDPVHAQAARRSKPRRRPTPAAKTRSRALQASPVLHATDADFDAILASGSTPVLLDLWAPWCGPCQTLGPRLEEVARTLEGQVRVIQVDVDESPGLSDRFNVRSIPLLVFLRGDERTSLVGLRSVKELEAWIRARMAATAPSVPGRNQA
jgi:thioredoxin